MLKMRLKVSRKNVLELAGCDIGWQARSVNEILPNFVSTLLGRVDI